MTIHEPPTPRPPAEAARPRIVKRYSNRKLYDTIESRYVTLPQIAVLVRNGEDVRIIDNATKEDLTSVTLAQILYEEERRQSRALPLAALKDLIHSSGEKLSGFFRDGPVGKILRKDGDPAPAESPSEVDPAPSEAPAPDAREAGPGKFEKLVEQSRASFAEWSAAVDERARRVAEAVYSAGALEKLTNDVRRLSQRVDELEARLAARDEAAGPEKE
jgi:polyhydroxyalkanoate synthesis repressor PhaR